MVKRAFNNEPRTGMKTAERKNARKFSSHRWTSQCKTAVEKKIESNVVRSVEEESEKEDTGKKGDDE